MNTTTKIAVLAISVFALTAPAFADGWQIETVDCMSTNPGPISFALDSSDNPHISYGNDNNIEYAYWNGATWEIREVTDKYAMYNSIALDSSGNPHISFGAVDLYYAYWNGSSWEVSTVDANNMVGGHNSIVLDSSDNPHISYHDFIKGDLKYAYLNGVKWVITAVDTIGVVGADTSIALDSNDNPHISYVDFENERIKYARWNGSSWVINVLEPLGRGRSSNSIAVDSNGNPHISFFDYANHDLKYAYFNGSSWEVTLPDTESYTGSSNSIILDNYDNPHILYSDHPGDVKHAYWNNSLWEISTVDSADNVFAVGKTIALDSNGNPHISYGMGWPDPYLKYAYYFNSTAPGTFDLLSPGNGGMVYEPVTLDWENSADDQHPITYKVRYSTDPSFSTFNDVNDLANSTYIFPDGSLTYDETYYWKVEASNGNEITWSNQTDWSFTFNDTGIEDDEGNLPTTFALHSAVPNPNDGSATISFALPETCEVELTLYDIKGRKIETLATGSHQPGEYSATVSGLSSGVYIYELKAGEFVSSKKMVVR